jgi:uncharacterized protein (DUF1800 family)
MAFNPASLPPDQAWAPLPAGQWDAAAARHLLQRIGFSAPQTAVDRAVCQGLHATFQENFGALRPMPMPAPLADYLAEKPAMQSAMDAAERTGTHKFADQYDNFFQAGRRATYRESMEQWLAFARDPQNSAQENLVMFLCGVLVVAFNKISNPEWIFGYQSFIRASLANPYPEICRALPRTVAMGSYLDLDTSTRAGPNENYARELMELFTLGEGNYTESDVKEVARALTGIRYENDRFVFDPSRWDSGPKTIFGKTGPWGADNVVDLIFTQPAARTHLPARFLSYYLSDDPLPDSYLESLGALWQQQGWRIDALAHLVFSSKLFYDPAFRGNLIKSPVRFLLGMYQDLNLDICPYPSDHNINVLEAAGQAPFDPPNVRGWLGGRLWLNPSSWFARAELVHSAFTPVAIRLDPEEAQWPKDIPPNPQANFFVRPGHFEYLAALPPDEAAARLVDHFLPGAPAPAYRAAIADYLKNTAGPRDELLSDSAQNLLLSPLYQVC